MIGTLGLFGTVAGAIVSRIAARLPDHMETLETGAGFLLIAGLRPAVDGLKRRLNAAGKRRVSAAAPEPIPAPDRRSGFPGMRSDRTCRRR